jgi:hypothetical protein
MVIFPLPATSSPIPAIANASPAWIYKSAIPPESRYEKGGEAGLLGLVRFIDINERAWAMNRIPRKNNPLDFSAF